MTRAPNTGEVIISRTELDTLIDSHDRSLNSIAAIERVLKGALSQFEQEKATIEQCKFALERYRRAAS